MEKAIASHRWSERADEDRESEKWAPWLADLWGIQILKPNGEPAAPSLGPKPFSDPWGRRGLGCINGLEPTGGRAPGIGDDAEAVQQLHEDDGAVVEEHCEAVRRVLQGAHVRA